MSEGKEVGECEEKFDGTGMSPVEIALSGSGFIGHHGGKKTRGAASEALRFAGFSESRGDEGRHIVLKAESGELSVDMHYVLSAGTARTYCVVAGEAPPDVGICFFRQYSRAFFRCGKEQL